MSEGQAYALLLDVAVGNRTQFSEVWQWSQRHLSEPDGLLAYHWNDGRVTDTNSAADADLDIARALMLAAHKWNNAAWNADARAYAAAVLANETVTIAGRIWLVAGPWARQGSLYTDPSYLDPETFAILAANTGDQRWSQIAASSALVVAADTNNGRRLPSDWAQIDSSGRVRASPPPGGGSVLYGYDAFRTLVRQTEGCAAGNGPAVIRALEPLAAATASPKNRANTYDQDATVSQPGDNPLMLVAAAGSAMASGDAKASGRYLDQAAAASAHQPSYYLDAWVALGRYFLTTNVLTGCPT